MLNARFTAFTVSELLKGKHQGKGRVKTPRLTFYDMFSWERIILQMLDTVNLKKTEFHEKETVSECTFTKTAMSTHVAAKSKPPFIKFAAR